MTGLETTKRLIVDEPNGFVTIFLDIMWSLFQNLVIGNSDTDQGCNSRVSVSYDLYVTKNSLSQSSVMVILICILIFLWLEEIVMC